MRSKFLSLGKSDFVKGLYMFVGSAVFGSLYLKMQEGGFSVWTTDWIAVGKDAVDISIVTTFTYLVKNLFTNNVGKIMDHDVE